METTPATVNGTRIEYVTRLAWQMRYYFYDDDPVDPLVYLAAEQRLPGFSDLHCVREELVLDIDELVHSVRQAGDYYPVNCTCYDPACSGINERARVLHDGDYIIWEADTDRWALALHRDFADGPLHHIQTIRWVFEREQYRQDINRLQQDMRDHIERINPDTFKRFWISDQHHQHEPLPDLRHLSIQVELEPGLDSDGLMQWPVPVLEPGPKNDTPIL